MGDPKLSSLAHQDGTGWGSARACETRHLPPLEWQAPPLEWQAPPTGMASAITGMAPPPLAWVSASHVQQGAQASRCG